MPRVDLAFPHLFTNFPPRIRASLTNLSADPPTPPAQTHRTTDAYRTSGTSRDTGRPLNTGRPAPRYRSFYRISGLHRTSDPARTTGRPVPAGRPTNPETADFVQSRFRYHPPSATTTHLPQPPSFSRSEFEKCVSLCLGYLSCGFTVSLDV